MAEFFGAVEHNQNVVANFHRKHLEEVKGAYSALFENTLNLESAMAALRARIEESGNSIQV